MVLKKSIHSLHLPNEQGGDSIPNCCSLEHRAPCPQLPVTKQFPLRVGVRRFTPPLATCCWGYILDECRWGAADQPSLMVQRLYYMILSAWEWRLFLSLPWSWSSSPILGEVSTWGLWLLYPDFLRIPILEEKGHSERSTPLSQFQLLSPRLGILPRVDKL